MQKGIIQAMKEITNCVGVAYTNSRTITSAIRLELQCRRRVVIEA